MSSTAKSHEESKIRPVREDELPPEFKKFDRPLGLEQHVFNRIWLGFTNICMAYYFLYLIPFGIIPRSTLIPGFIYGYLTGLGTTMGSHRYWTHRTFKATRPLQVLMMLMQTAGAQYPIFKWCRDHRVHHKYMDTDADPHSAARGFWFSHIGWLLERKHPEVEEKLKIVDISDLIRDPVLRFQSKYYWELMALVFFALPLYVFHLLYPEVSLFHLNVMNFGRYGISLHFTFLVNSVAHMWGDKPYDKYITPTENKWVSLLAVGEGWHNYHHTFPWDYKAAELGFSYNLSTVLIHLFAKIGWAYDMKTVSHKLLSERINRTGDGSHPLYVKNNNETEDKMKLSPNTCWGWGDEQLTKEDMEVTETVFERSTKTL